MFARIPLTNGGCAMVDPEDVALVSEYKWHASKRKNGEISGVKASGGSVRMHRLLTDAPKGMEVDHINGNPLDNRKANLRVCTHAENARNARRKKLPKSGYKGVEQQGKRFRAVITVNGKRFTYGPYDTPERAHLAYRTAATALHGDFACFS